jgi:hypothetical protein
MSENKNKEEITEIFDEEVPANLVKDETIVPQEKFEEFKTAVDEVIKSKSVKETTTTEDVITAPVADQVVPGLGPVADGVMGSSLVSKTEKPKVSTSKSKAGDTDKVAIFSTKHVTWAAIGSKVYRGYNIVKPEHADKWLTKDFIRLATPEEVAKEFGL